ncbi:hypothetical protein ACFOZ1_02700 [Gracilibacillus marinus]|jgi:3-dehydroquinate dehydratase|uniref:DUF2564 family protein n=1 Tax=Gracilibacillus marinus TaxID=630535 RepID=A0ABV8VUG8_9BACI
MKKGNNISSLQDQNQLAQAQQSLLHLQHAMQQAQTNPNTEIMSQIQQAIEKAERSLLQAEAVTDDIQAINLVRNELQRQQDTYQNLVDQNFS